MINKFTPLRDYVLILPLERKLSDLIDVIATEPFTRGKVMAVGPGRILPDGSYRALAVSPGDVIWYCPHGNRQPLTIDGVEHRVIMEGDIGFIEDDSND